MQSPEQIAEELLSRLPTSIGRHRLAFLTTEIAAALTAYGAECAAQERAEIRVKALAIRANYPEELFPTLPAAAGARLAIDRLLAVLT